MPTHGLKAGTENITTNVPAALAKQVDALVKASGISRSKYVAILLKDAVAKKRVFAVRKAIEEVEEVAR